MKKLILLLFICAGSMCGFGQTASTEADKLLKSLVSEKSVMGASAGFAIDSEMVWDSAAGYFDDDEKAIFTVDTKVRIASISKPITAVAVMQLVEKDLIDINAPIQTYIEEYPKKITVKQLLSHTSGIDGYENAKEAETTENYPTLTEAMAVFMERELLFDPGTNYSYATYGYVVLGVVIERVTGLTFEYYIQQNIFDTAGMSNSGVDKFGIKETDSDLFHSKKKGKIKEAEENNLSNRIPGGGFYSTTNGMLKFGNALMNNTLLSEQTFTMMLEHHSLEKVNNGYGYGWFLYGQSPNEENSIIGHTGEQTGASGQFFIVPGKNLVVVVLSNTTRALKEVSRVAGNLIGFVLK